MTWQNKPVWTEGMFLRPQHFQQFERFVGAQLDARTRPLVSHGWGLSTLRFDEGLLLTGKVALIRAAGIFDDGTPFAFPNEADGPLPLDVPRDMRDQVVHLCVPQARSGGADVMLDHTAHAETRFLAHEFEASDTVQGEPSRVPLNVGRLQLSLRHEGERLDGYSTIPIARVVERRADDSVVLQDLFVPTVLAVDASPTLIGFVSSLEGLLHQRAQAIAGRLGTPGHKGIADITDFLMLMTANRAEAMLRHLASLPFVHPAALYERLVVLAAELSTMTQTGNRPHVMPPYRHRGLSECFEAVIADLRRSLSIVFEQAAVPIPLELRDYGIRVGQIDDPSLFTDANFVLAARAAVDTESIRVNLPRRIKLGSVEHIRDLVMRQLSGVNIFPMPAEPRQIPFRANTVYFSINTQQDQWQAARTSGALALHIAGDIPDLELEMWAIRTRS